MSSVSKEAATHGNTLIHDGEVDSNQHGTTAMPPSHTVAPTKVDTLPQQGSTQPGDGGEVHADGHIHHGKASDLPNHPVEKVPFKEQVIGYAQKTRGTLLGQHDLKEHGEKILEGQTTHEQDRHGSSLT